MAHHVQASSSELQSPEGTHTGRRGRLENIRDWNDVPCAVLRARRPGLKTLDTGAPWVVEDHSGHGSVT